MTEPLRWQALGKSAAVYGGAALLSLLAAAAAP